MHNITVALFEVSSEAYQAFSELKAYTQTADSLIAQAVLVKKKNGVISVAESTDFSSNAGDAAWAGGLLGALVGVLGGPIGVLLGGSVGALIGSDAGMVKSAGEVSLLESVAGKLQDGDTAVLLLVQEQDEAVLDQFFGRFKTHIARWDAAVVQQDIFAAVEAQGELARQAREKLHEQRKVERKEKIAEFKNDVKQKFDELAAKIKSR